MGDQVTLDKESDMLVFEQEKSPEEEKYGEDKELIQIEDEEEVAGSEKDIKDDKQKDEDGSSEQQDVKNKSSSTHEYETQLSEEELINNVVEHNSQDQQCTKDKVLNKDESKVQVLEGTESSEVISEMLENKERYDQAKEETDDETKEEQDDQTKEEQDDQIKEQINGQTKEEQD